MTYLIKLSVLLAVFLFNFQGTAIAQDNLSETFKKHFNHTVQNVKSTDDPAEQRALLNSSFDKILVAVQRVDESANLTSDQRNGLIVFKDQIEQKQSELNGADGFDEVQDEELIDFSDYSQQEIEQANRTVTISVTTALLVVLILLLL